MKERSRGSDLMREGYRGTDLEHGQGEKNGSITADLNTHGQSQEGSNLIYSLNQNMKN